MIETAKTFDTYKDFDKIVNVGIADIKFASAPLHLRTNLGSCVALVLYDKISLTGGLVHVMMPKSYKNELKPGKCADTAVPLIIDTMTNEKKCRKSNLVAKIFGGAKMLSNSAPDIGQQNVDEVIRLVKESGIKITAMKTGGTKGYLVQLNTETGMVMCRIFGQEPEYF